MVKRLVLSLILALVLAFIGIGSLNIGEAQAALAFHSGFESGNTFEWASVTGSLSIQTTIKKTGSYALKSDGNAYVSNGLTHKATTFYLYIAGAPAANIYIFGTDNGNGIVLNTDKTLSVNSDTPTKRITGTTVLALETWHRVSVSNSSAVPSVKLFLNGSQEGSTYGTAMTFAGNLGVITTVLATAYFDDYAADSADQTADLGDIRILLSLPNAAGTYEDFDTRVSVAEPNEYQNVDDAPGSISDADYNQQAATTAVLDTYNLQNSSTIGIGASDTINAVRVLARMKRGGGGAGGGRAVQWRDNATDGYQSITATTEFVWYFGYYATMPADSGAWTQTRFDAFQVGANHGKGSTDAQDTFISAQMVMVAYTPAGGTPAITVSPTTYDFGVVAASSTPSTITTYFTIDNTSDIQTDQTISVTTSTWSGGVTWTHSDTATPGANTAGLKANKGGTWGTGDVIVKYSSPLYIAENQAANTDYQFGLKLWAPTSFTDGVQKQIVVRITAVAG